MPENSLEIVKQKFLTYLKESGRAKLTIINYERTMRYFYNFLKQKGIENILDVTQEIILEYQDYVYETLDHSENSLRFYINELRRFFDHLIKMGVVCNNPVVHMQIKQKKIERIDIITRYYSRDEIITRYKHCLREKDISFYFYERERVHINTFLYFLEKEKITSIYKISSEVIEKYKAYLNSSEYQGGKGLNIYDQIEKLRSLRRFYKWLLKEKMLKDDPTAYLKIGEYQRFLESQNNFCSKATEKPCKTELQLYQDKFLEYKCSLGFSPETLKKFKLHLNILIRFLHSRDIHAPDSVKKEDILCYLNYLSNTYKTTGGGYLAQSSKVGLVGTTKQFFSFLTRFEYIPKDPAQQIDSLKSDNGIPRTLMNEREINTLLDMPDLTKPTGIRDKAILETLYSTGMRASELSHLTKEDIDFTQGLVRINYPKGGRPQQRIIPIGKIALEYITLYLNKARDYLLNGLPDILFLSRSGKRLTHNELREIIKGYVFKAHFKKNITTHSFRVTCATGMLKNKADIRYVQQQLGHKKITSTQVYTRVVPLDLKKIHSLTHPREKKILGAKENSLTGQRKDTLSAGVIDTGNLLNNAECQGQPLTS